MNTAIVSYCNTCGKMNVAISTDERVLNDPDTLQEIVEIIEDGQKLAVILRDDVSKAEWCDCEKEVEE